MAFESLVYEASRVARAGDPRQAEVMLEHVVSSDQANVAAWWWLGHVTDDPKKRKYCRDTAQKLAARDEAALVTVQHLLEENGAPRLSRFTVVPGSRSLGINCPYCSLPLEAGDVIVHCPENGHAHHDECWEGNAYQCTLLACPGVGTINKGRALPEPAAEEQGFAVLEEHDLPDAPRGETTEEKEEKFKFGLMQRFFAAALERETERQRQQQAETYLDGLAYAIEESERQERAALAERLAKRANRSVLVGLLFGGFAGNYAYRHGLEAISAAGYVGLMVLLGCVVVGVQTAQPYSRFARVFYWMLPFTAAGAAFVDGIERWGAGFLAIAASAFSAFIAWRLLSRHWFRDRLGGIAFLGMLLTGFALYRLYLMLAPLV